MAEQEPPHSIDLGPRHTPPVRWNVEGMAETLHAKTFDVVHERPTFGAGKRLELEGTTTALELWEAVGYVRAESERSRAEAIGVQPVAITEEQVIFEGHHDDGVTRLSVARGGAVGFFTLPTGGDQAGQAAPHHLPLTESLPDSAEPARAIASDSEGAAAAAAEELPEGEAASVPEGPFEVFPAPLPEEQREKSNRVEVMGNVAWEPKLREFQSGNARLQFSVAQHLEDGTTRYHLVKAFKDRARKYNGQIHRGDAVHLVGGRATEKYKDKDGNARDREFIILWGLKPLGGGS